MAVAVVPLEVVGGLSKSFRDRLDTLPPPKEVAIDLGTGTGRVALLLAKRYPHVVALDIDANAIEAARDAARHLKVPNVEFVVADAEASDLRSFNTGNLYELATAHLFLSLPLLERVHAALAPGGYLLAYGLESENWVEAGGSRFNLSPDAVRGRLDELGFEVHDERIERTVHQFADAAAGREYLKDRRLWTKWNEDGRWSTWRKRFRPGPATLTESRLFVWATRS